MREIKFRVWDGELMHTVSELIFCMGLKLDGKGLKFFGPGVGQGWIDGKTVHLMQYTGLDDKNGVEIYEGDVLKCSSLIIKDDRWVEIVEVIKDIRHVYYFANYDELEVIGNTYETPELLEESK